MQKPANHRIVLSGPYFSSYVSCSSSSFRASAFSGSSSSGYVGDPNCFSMCSGFFVRYMKYGFLSNKSPASRGALTFSFFLRYEELLCRCSLCRLRHRILPGRQLGSCIVRRMPRHCQYKQKSVLSLVFAYLGIAQRRMLHYQDKKLPCPLFHLGVLAFERTARSALRSLFQGLDHGERSSRRPVGSLLDTCTYPRCGNARTRRLLRSVRVTRQGSLLRVRGILDSHARPHQHVIGSSRLWL